MKIRTIYFALLILGLAAALGSCRNDIADPVFTDEVRLTLLPTVEERTEATIRTRASEAFFFEDGDTITVTVTTSRADNPKSDHEYIYNGTDNTFYGDFFFRPDMTYITELVALWPAANSGARTEVITDQRRYFDYKQANWMKAEANSKNIMPTAAPVPLLFTHEQSRVTYRLAGQNANGLVIKELLLELTADLDGSGVEKGHGFWAYCGDRTENSEEIGEGALNVRMILPAGVKLGPYSTDPGRTRIGLVTVGAPGTTDSDYRALIYFPNDINIELKPNTDYLVTLTPEGYDLYATITVGGFSQSEGHVAIPFQLPVLNPTTTKYEITTVAQLVTIAWLLDGDLNGQLKTDWLSRTFDIPNPIEVSAKVQAEGERYLKASVLKSNSGKFTNSNNATYSDGTNVF